MKTNIENKIWKNFLEKTKSIFKKETFIEFLNRLKDLWFDINNKNYIHINEFLQDLKSFILSQKPKTNYTSEILQQKDSFIYNYEWKILTFWVDVKNSTHKTNIHELIKILSNLANLFEEIYEDIWFKIISQVEGDKIYIGFFSKISKYKNNYFKQFEIFSLFYTILKLFTDSEFHLEAFFRSKKAWERIMTIFKNIISQTPLSEDLNKQLKKLLNSKWKNHTISKDIIELLIKNYKSISNETKKRLLETLDRTEFLNYFSIDPTLKQNIAHIISTLKYFEEKDFHNEAIILSTLINLFINNPKLYINQIKEETISAGKKIIWFNDKNTDLFLVLEGKIKLEINWNPLLSKVVEGKTILWEMSVLNERANASVYALTKLKVIRIPRKLIKQILKDNTITQNIKKYFLKLIKIYAKKRNIENISLQELERTLMENLDLSKKQLNRTLNNFYKYISLLWEWQKGKKQPILKTNQTNNKLFIVKAGSKVKIERNWKVIISTVSSDTIFWEITYIWRKDGIKNLYPNANVTLLEGEYKEIPFEKIDQILNQQLWKEIERDDNQDNDQVKNIIDLFLRILAIKRKEEDEVFLNVTPQETAA